MEKTILTQSTWCRVSNIAKFGLSLMLLILLQVQVSAQTFTTAPGATAIPDNDCPTQTLIPITVSGLATTIDGTFGLETAEINITHTWDSDLDISLVAPDGTSISLSANNGSLGDNYTNTVFDDAAASCIGDGTAPFTGTFAPDSPLGAANNGQDPNGTWNLSICDGANGDTGSVNSASITFSGTPAAPASNDPAPFSATPIAVTAAAPFVESFEALPAADCFGSIAPYFNQDPTTGETWVIQTGNLGHSADAAQDGASFIAVDDSAPASSDVQFMLPPVDISALIVPELTFWLHSDAEDGSSAGSNLNALFTVELTTDDGATWTSVFTNQANTSTANGEYEQFIIDLAAFAGATDLVARFTVDETANDHGNGFDDDISLDLVTFREMPACFVDGGADITQDSDASGTLADCGDFVTLPAPVLSGGDCLGTATNDFNGTADASDIYPVGTTQVIWSAQNSAGDFSLDTVLVTVNDVEDPTFNNCSTGTTISLDPGECDAIVTFDLSATDNCSTATIAVTQNSVTASPYTSVGCGITNQHLRLFDGQPTEITITSVDVAFNGAANGSVPVNVYTLEDGADFTYANLVLVGSGDAAGAAAQTLANVAVNAVIPANTRYVVEVVNLTPATGFEIGYNTEAATGTSYIAGCTIAEPTDINLVLPGGFQVVMVVNADAVALAVEETSATGFVSGDAFPIGDTDLEFTATDAAGNTAVCAFTVTINEFANPSATLAANDNVQVSLDENGLSEVTTDMILEGGPYGCYDEYLLTRTPACVGCPAPLPGDPGSGPNAGFVWVNCNDVGQTITIMVTDPDTGNSTWSTITVEDKIAPTINCVNESVSCTANTTPIFTAPVTGAFALADNPGTIIPQGAPSIVSTTLVVAGVPGEAVITDLNVGTAVAHPWVSDLTVSVTSPNGTTVILVDGACGANDNIDATWDDEGNPLGCQGTAPTITGTVNPQEALSAFDGEPLNGTWTLTVEDGFGDGGVITNFSLDAQWQIAQTSAPTTDDNCGPVTLDFVDSDITGDCAGPSGEIFRTWTATDASGNTAQCVQIITIDRPTIGQVALPADITVSCAAYNANNDAIAPTIAGAGEPTINGGAIDNGSICNITSTLLDEVIIDDICEGTFKTRRKWLIIDWCTGDEIEHNQLVKVIDETGPALVCPAGPYEIDATAASYNEDLGPHAACAGIIPIPAISGTDDCSSIASWTTTITTLAGDVVASSPTNGGSMTGVPLYDTDPTTVGADYLVTYTAYDECGNESICQVPLTVTDRVAPVAICDEITQVSLSSDGIATVCAEDLDDGSYDNCTDVHYWVARPSSAFDTSPYNKTYTPCTEFNCGDIGNDNMVFVLIADDVADAAAFNGQLFLPAVTSSSYAVTFEGHYGLCMVSVLVEDKLPPYKVQDVADFNIDCDVYYNNLEVALDLASADGNDDPAILNTLYGRPVYADNCDTIVDHTFAVNINSCGEGTITRTWTVEDGATPANVGPTCQQLIIVKHINNWEVAFPDDVTLECTEGMNPGEDEDLFGEPTVFFDDCELVAVAQEDQIFNIVPDACYKIIRTFTAINWCVYDGADEDVNNASTTAATTAADNTFVSARRFRDGTNGIIVYQQVIKVLDTVAPELTCPTLADVPVNANCVATVDLPEALATDCSFDVTITATTPNLGPNGATHIGTAPIGNVAPGTYTTTYTATDNCGNSESCEMTFNVVDNKPPTPYCVGGLVVELMPVDTDGDGNADQGMVDIWASDFDAGSFDNCPGAVKLTVWLNADNYAGSLGLGYSDAPTNLNGGLPIACDSPFDWNFGNNDVYLYVEDASGNVDFCITTLVIESNPNIPLCDDEDNEDATIAGNINTPAGTPVNMVSVDVNSGFASIQTTDNGEFLFSVPANGDYTVVPSKDMNPLNGVTTYDLVLINQHILGTNPLDTPYKMIAADANNSGSVTAFDLVELRRLILLINTELPNNSSWRFVDAAANLNNGWSLANGFPETVSFNNLTGNEVANFVGVKIGDVNGSAIANNVTGNTEERTTGSVNLLTDDRALVAGETYNVTFNADQALMGYQFTMNFDAAALEFAGIVEGQATAANFGLALLEEGAITASWNTEAAKAAEFTVSFTATADAQLSEVISINSRYTAAEAYAEGNLLDINLDFNNATAAANFELYQNSPNPFRGSTMIGFNLPEAGNATLTIMDVAGKVLSTVNGDYAKGYNQVTVSNIDATGVLYYTLETAGQTATRKMVIMN